ncbi:hypothetical protein K431DRAFT_235422 [Polychaeton citri CBS 116435]|uniref:DUF4440 domain-containing protein n=1 Tax=Polychaeton citri CBS 116435 TaxID=1314669 RepID=A0A9P4PZ18_9PEZI|nr:hypothetical protein K431DRAFT_235422 [Polychaeton citri CBS 116435]
MESPAFKAEILGLEEATWKALKHSGEALIPYLAEDCIMQFPMGMKLTRDSEPSVRDILHSPAFVPWKAFLLDEVDVTNVGRDGAVISYRANATRPPTGVPGDDGDEDVKFEALCSTVWRKDGGTWLMIFHQQTPAVGE